MGEPLDRTDPSPEQVEPRELSKSVREVSLSVDTKKALRDLSAALDPLKEMPDGECGNGYDRSFER